MLRRVVAFLAAAFLVACDASSTPGDASITHPDANDLGTLDASSRDSETDDQRAAAVGDWVDLTLTDGALSGELVYIYDQRKWWAAEETETWLVSAPSAFAAYPDDRSARFIDASEITSAEFLRSVGPSQRELLRQEGIVLERSPLAGVAHVITGHESYHLEEDGRGDFAWDLVVTSSITGVRWFGDGLANEDYLVFDRPIYLPTGGTVVEVVRDAPDNVPGFYPEGALNNMVGVHLGGQYYVYLLHFREGSIPLEIQPGVWLDEGAYLGRAGNSGVSLEPHVHMTVLYFDVITERTWSVPSEFANLYVSTTTAGAELERYSVPTSGDFIASIPF